MSDTTLALDLNGALSMQALQQSRQIVRALWIREKRKNKVNERMKGERAWTGGEIEVTRCNKTR